MVHEAQTQWQRFDVFLGTGWKQLLGGSSQDLVQWLLTMVIVVVTVFTSGCWTPKWPNFMASPRIQVLGAHPTQVPTRWVNHPLPWGAMGLWGLPLGVWGMSRSYPRLRFLSAHLSQRSPVSVLMSFCGFSGERCTRYPYEIWDILLQGDFLQNRKVVIRKIRKLRVWGWAWTFYPLKIKAVLALSREWGNEALYGYKGDSFPHSLLRACQFFMCDFIYYIYYSF